MSFKVRLWSVPMQVHHIDSLDKAIETAASFPGEADVNYAADDFPLAQWRFNSDVGDGLGDREIIHPIFEENKWRLNSLTSPAELAGLQSILATTEKLCSLRREQRVSQR